MIEALKNIWNGFKYFLSLIKALVTKGWDVLTGALSVIAALWLVVKNGVSDAVTFIQNFWSTLSGSKTAFEALAASGVPVGVLNGATYANNFVPVKWLLTMTATMFFLWIGSILVRVIKSWIPTVS